MSTASSRAAIDVTPRLLIAADLAVLPADLPSGSVDYELDNGRLITMVPPGNTHGSVQARFVTELVLQGERKGLGQAWSEVGIILWRDPDRVVGADAAFVTNECLPVRESPEGYLQTIPNLVVEIRSKNDTPAYIQRKVQDYLAAGVVVMLLVDPAARTASVFRPNAEPVFVQENEPLDIDDVIAGFQLTLDQVLDG